MCLLLGFSDTRCLNITGTASLNVSSLSIPSLKVWHWIRFFSGTWKLQMKLCILHLIKRYATQYTHITRNIRPKKVLVKVGHISSWANLLSQPYTPWACIECLVTAISISQRWCFLEQLIYHPLVDLPHMDSFTCIIRLTAFPQCNFSLEFPEILS